MKTLNLVTLIVLCCTSFTNAQDASQKIKEYKAWVLQNHKPFKTKGLLYEIKDSSIIISSPVILENRTHKFELIELDINNIETIKLRKKNNIGYGIIIGALAGFATGGMIGLLSGDDPPGWFSFTAEQKAIMGGISLGIVGIGTGALIGSFKVKIPISGSLHNYNRNKNKLRKYSIKKE